MEDVYLDRYFDYPVSRLHEFRVGDLKIIAHRVYLSGVLQSFAPSVANWRVLANCRFTTRLANARWCADIPAVVGAPRFRLKAAVGRTVVPNDGEIGDRAIGLVCRPTLIAVDPNAL
jgi:hypothetical protein